MESSSSAMCEAARSSRTSAMRRVSRGYSADIVEAPSGQNMFEAWADGWLCDAESRYVGFWEAFPSAQSWLQLADLNADIAEKTRVICRTLQFMKIPIREANFVCPSDSSVGEQ